MAYREVTLHSSALEQAHYEMIADEEPFYGAAAALPGVWATGKTLEDCRRNLAEAVEIRLLRPFPLAGLLAAVYLSPARPRARHRRVPKRRNSPFSVFALWSWRVTIRTSVESRAVRRCLC